VFATTAAPSAFMVPIRTVLRVPEQRGDRQTAGWSWGVLLRAWMARQRRRSIIYHIPASSDSIEYTGSHVRLVGGATAAVVGEAGIT
jgi:hypothetical protein